MVSPAVCAMMHDQCLDLFRQSGTLMDDYSHFFLFDFIDDEFKSHPFTSSAPIIAQNQTDVLLIALIGHFERVSGSMQTDSV